MNVKQTRRGRADRILALLFLLLASSLSLQAAAFDPQVGPAFRLAVDLGDPLHAYYGLAGGQSGLPGSPFYADGLEPWLRAEPRVLWMHRADVAYHARGTWELRPDLP